MYDSRLKTVCQYMCVCICTCVSLKRVTTAVLNQEEQRSVEGTKIKCHPEEIKRRTRKIHTEERMGRKRKKTQRQEVKKPQETERGWEEERTYNQ